MEKLDNKKRNIMLVVLIILILIGFSLFKFRNKKTDDNLVIVNNKYILLTDYSRFFTVNSCVYKYIQYLQSEDFDSLFKVLDKDYVNKVGINNNNVYNYLPNLTDGMYSYSSKKMYYEKINDDYIKYYVYGYVVQDIMDSVGEKQQYSFVVDLDTKNETFSIAPYSGDLFKEEL